MNNLTIKEIVKKYLKENGYSGLWSENEDCGCSSDDLFLCEGDYSFVGDCKVGYKKVCDKCNKINNCKIRDNDDDAFYCIELKGR